MKLQVALALVCVLFPKALALKCYECVPELFGQCTDTETDCPDQCDSKTTVMNFGGLQLETHSKGCAVAEQCVTVSLNLGMIKLTLNSKCCSTDLCNSEKVPALPKGSPNGKMCYGCTDQDCSDTVNCEGDEDRCISATVKQGGVKMRMKGCVTRNFCTGDSSSMEEAGITGDVGCCEGNLCNSTKTINLNLLLMLVLLFSSILLV